VDRVLESVDCAGPVHRGPATIAAPRSSASGHSGARELRPRGEREGGRASELNGGVAAAREAVEEHLTGGRSFSLEGRRRGGVGGVGGFTEGGVGFYRAEARQGRAERLQLPA
jgi:hypothetical protein